MKVDGVPIFGPSEQPLVLAAGEAPYSGVRVAAARDPPEVDASLAAYRLEEPLRTIVLLATLGEGPADVADSIGWPQIRVRQALALGVAQGSGLSPAASSSLARRNSSMRDSR
jgi:hypothetical protein